MDMELDTVAKFGFALFLFGVLGTQRDLNIQPASFWYTFFQHGNAKFVGAKNLVKTVL